MLRTSDCTKLSRIWGTAKEQAARIADSPGASSPAAVDPVQEVIRSRANHCAEEAARRSGGKAPARKRSS
jgi:hypothetical protein